MKQIELTQGKCALVDDEDFEFLSQFKWHYNKNGYAVWQAPRGEDGKRANIFMHRLLLAEPMKGKHIDHINGQKLDNRRANLRICTPMENFFNRGANRNNTSGFKGVVASGRKWCAQIKAGEKNLYLGTFEKKEDAARAYNRVAAKLHGQFARLNDVPETVDPD